MQGGNGTLSGGTGSDTFELNYSADKPITAVIEDLEPARDKIVVNFDGNAAPQLTSSTLKSGDVVWTDGGGLFSLTLKSVRENDYLDSTASEEAWEVFYLTNTVREIYDLPLLTMSQGLTAGAQIRAEEITEKGNLGLLTDHDRPDGSDFSTVLDDKYHNYGENLEGGARTPLDVVVNGWMRSSPHRENILDEKGLNFQKLGVGYNYDDEDKSNLRFYWTQLFADSLNNPETVSTAIF